VSDRPADSLPPVIDCHAHTSAEQLLGDGRGLRRRLERCRDYGVVGVVFSVPFGESGPELPLDDVARIASEVGATVGVSLSIEPPTRADELPGLQMRLRRAGALAAELAEEKRVVAIGEAGLDYYWPLVDFLESQGVDEPDAISEAMVTRREQLLNEPEVRHILDAQQQAFSEAIRWAIDLGLPLVVHERDAGAGVAALLEDSVIDPERVMLHCYSGTPEAARKAAEAGYRISVPASVVGREPYRSIARAVELESLVLETDSPYHSPLLGLWQRTAKAVHSTPLTGNARQQWVSRERKRLLEAEVDAMFPGLTFELLEEGQLKSEPAGQYYARPDRRRQNEPFLVRFGAEEIARLKGVDVATVCEATTANATALFGTF